MTTKINGTGTAANPAITGDDTDTGLSFGTDTVNINTGGTTRATIDSSGALDVPTDFPIKVNGSEKLRIDSSGRVMIGQTSSVVPFMISATASGFGGLNTVGVLGDTTAAASGVGGALTFSGRYNSSNSQVGFASIRGIKENGTNDNYNGALTLNTRPNGGVVTERMRIDSSGHVGIGTNNPEYLLNVVSGNNDMCRFQQTTNNQGDDYTAIVIKHAAATSGQNGVGLRFQNTAGTTVGKIDFGQSSTQYRTSSDYRLKENAEAISDGITRLKTLKPYRFNWISEPDQPKVDGFFAHEVTAVPEAVSGTKDEVDSDNNPVYQGIDQSKLVPLLTAALQEAITKIETLETKVAALEAA